MANFFRNIDKEKHSDILIAKSAKWTDDELGMEWLQCIYEPYSRKLISPDEKRPLILDGHSSHIDERFVDFCESHNVAVFCLPPHSTHLLQMFDVGLLDLFNTSMGLELTSTFATMVKTLALHLSTFFQSILKHVGKPNIMPGYELGTRLVSRLAFKASPTIYGTLTPSSPLTFPPPWPPTHRQIAH